MTSTAPMLVSLADVARLAKVRRPVVSMWRARYAAKNTPFPSPVARSGNEERFDAEQVVSWLEQTYGDKYPDVRVEVASVASLTAASTHTDETLFAALTALLTLKSVTGEQFGARSPGALLDLAEQADPDDSLLLREITALGKENNAMASHADSFADAAFSPAEAFERLLANRFRHYLPGHAAVALREEAQALVAEVAHALAVDADIAPVVLVDPTLGGSDLLVATARLYDGESAPTVLTSSADESACRLVRRRLRVHDFHREPLDVADGVFEVSEPAVLLAQFPAPGSPAMTAEAILSAIDNIAIQMDDRQRAVIIAPAAELTDRLRDPVCEQLRDSVLRVGRLRAIVRLPKGLVTARPRQQLAMWVLGPSHSQVPAERQWIMLADLANVPLTADVIDDVVTDMVASMGDEAMVRGHSFRFTRLVRTRVLLASRGNLVEAEPRVERAHPGSGPEMALRIAALQRQLGPLAFDVTSPSDADDQTAPERTTVAEALAAGSLRMVAGNRIDAEDLHGGNGAPIIGPAELTGTAQLGDRRMDRLVFGASYGVGRYTEPGDVVFCTSPRVAAMVDEHGGSVVLAPARVLRVNADSGLLPRILAADINSVAPQAKQWRLWRLRRAPVEQSASLSVALQTIDTERTATLDRLGRLDELAALLTAGVTDRHLTITDSRQEGR